MNHEFRLPQHPYRAMPILSPCQMGTKACSIMKLPLSKPSPGTTMKHHLLLVLLCGGVVAAHAQPGPGYALRFDNNASYVAVPQAVGLNSFPFTVMAWVNTSATSGQQGLVNKYVAGSQNGWNLF